ncbi:hypothetical protein MPER_06913 [Moniliophthora perniciosa FA553]|nr:hypothetical protein MPER_06913 [Moniliophthora perniciosa FA553]
MSSEDSYKKVVLVTGGNGGIGFELVRLLAEKGHKVYIGARNATAGKEAEERLKNEFGLKATFVHLDVNDSASIQAAKEFIERSAGHLDVLANNAAVLGSFQDPSSGDAKEYARVFNTNLFGIIECTTAFMPLIRKAKPGYGAVLNVTSGLGSNSTQASPQAPKEFLRANAYSASKAALNSYTIALANELAEEKIRVNSGKTPRQGAELLAPWVLLGPKDDDKTCQYYSNGTPLNW